MKDLPKVFANKIEKELNNTQEFFYGSDRGIKKTNNMSITKKINLIFADSHHVYKSKVNIETKDGNIVKTVVGRTPTNLITLEGELIPIASIIDISKY